MKGFDYQWYIVPLISDRYFEGVMYRQVYAPNKTKARQIADGVTITGVYPKGKIYTHKEFREEFGYEF